MITKMSLEETNRKAMVTAIAELTGEKPIYRAMPTRSYSIGDIIVARDGCIECADECDIITWLAEKSFFPMKLDTEGEEQQTELMEPTGLIVSLPRDGFPDSAIDRLKKLVDAKGALIRKALNTERLDIVVEDDTVSVPWWDTLPQPEEVHAHTGFIVALRNMAKEARRVVAREKEVESEKYAFRCFLLRLGYIREEHKGERKILLSRLSGHAAFRNQAEEDKFRANQKARRDAARAERETATISEEASE